MFSFPFTCPVSYFLELLKKITAMEENIISEIKAITTPATTAAEDSFNLKINDQEFDDCMSLLSADFNPQASSSYNPSAASSSYNPSPPYNPPPLPYHPPVASPSYSSSYPMTPQRQTVWTQPLTPVEDKVQKLLHSSRYQDVSKAGELAVRNAVILIWEDVMRRSGLGDNKGYYDPLMRIK